MSTITRTTGSANTPSGATILGSHFNTDLTAIFNDYNGNIDNTNIASNAAIAISKTTLGTFTPWTDWTPGYTGFSSNPTSTYARYMVLGKLCIVTYLINASGTSNASTFTITGFPIAIAAAASGMRFNVVQAIDNGSVVSTGGNPFGILATTTLTLWKDATGTNVWTSANGKYVNSFQIIYPID